MLSVAAIEVNSAPLTGGKCVVDLSCEVPEGELSGNDDDDVGETDDGSLLIFSMTLGHPFLGFGFSFR